MAARGTGAQKGWGRPAMTGGLKPNHPKVNIIYIIRYKVDGLREGLIRESASIEDPIYLIF